MPQEAEPPADPGAASLALPPAPESVRAARSYVVRFCRDRRLGDLCEVAALLTSELVTNAVVHGGGQVEVAPKAEGHALLVEVGDGSPMPPSHLHPGAGEEHGRGILLVESLATRWGVRPSGAGKVVWFEVR